MFSVAKRKVSLTSVLLILCLVPFLLSGVGYLYVSRLSEMLRDDLRNSLVNTSVHAAEVAQLRMTNALRALQDVAKNPIITNERVSIDIKRTFLAQYAKKVGWMDVIIVDTVGLGQNIAGKTLDISKRPRFDMILQGKQVYSDIFTTANYPKPTVSYSVPITSKKGFVIGALIVLDCVDNLHFVAKNTDGKLSPTGKDYYMDRRGVLLTESTNTNVTLFDALHRENPQYNPEDMDAAIYTREFLAKPLYFNGIRNYLVATPIGLSGWSIITVMPESVAREEIDSMMYFSVGVMLIMLVALLLFIFYILDMRKDFDYHKNITDAVLNTDNVLLMVLNPFGAVIYANIPLCDRMGWSDNGKNINIFRWMENMDMAELQDLVSTDESFVIPLLLMSPSQATALVHGEFTTEDVEKIYIQWSVLPNERPDTLVLLGTDVSAHKHRVEVSLTQSHNAHLRQILDSLTALVMVHELDGTVSMANASALRVFGELEGSNDQHFESMRHIMSPETLEELVDTRRQVIRSGSKASSAFSFIDGNGKARTFECIQTPIFDERGRVRATVSLNSDITRLHDLQQQLADEVQYLHEILDESPVGVFFSTQGQIRYCNTKAKQMAGLQIGGLAPDGSSMIAGDVKGLAACVRNSKKVYDMPFSIRTPSGDVQHLLITALYTNRHDEKVTIVWALDVTDIRRAQEELIEARDAAESATRAKTDFLATMSHEIRTPMNAVLGFLHVFDKSNLNDKQLDYLNKISISASGLLRIINDILDFSKIEANKMDLDLIPFNVRTSLDAVQGIMAFRAQEKNLALNFTIEDDVPEYIVADRERINQILLNLLGNAIKFTSEGSVSLDVRVISWESATQLSMRFSVTDTGIGLSEEQVSKLFQPFMQADTSTSRRFGGTGLGLVISQRLVQLMGGKISLTSELGKGTTFTVDVPTDVATATLSDTDAHLPQDAHALSQGASQEGMSDSQSAEEIAARLRGKRVLIAEDNMINQEIVNAMLEEYELEITFAENGQEAVQCATDNVYDLIFMDVQMPIMDGLTATKHIRALPLPHVHGLPIIAMTANVMLEDKRRCNDAGMDGHVAKPIDPQELHKTLVHFLASH